MAETVTLKVGGKAVKCVAGVPVCKVTVTSIEVVGSIVRGRYVDDIGLEGSFTSSDGWVEVLPITGS